MLKFFFILSPSNDYLKRLYNKYYLKNTLINIVLNECVCFDFDWFIYLWVNEIINNYD